MQTHDMFLFDNTTGKLLWKDTRPARGCISGKEAGSVKSDGRYRTVYVLGKRLYVHRIVWEMHYGEIPKNMCIDHIDGNGLNNAITNLRLTTRSGNQRNKKLQSSNKSGIPGVIITKSCFVVTCSSKYIIHTKDFFEACCARKSAELLHGYHENHGRTLL